MGRSGCFFQQSGQKLRNHLWDIYVLLFTCSETISEHSQTIVEFCWSPTRSANRPPPPGQHRSDVAWKPRDNCNLVILNTHFEHELESYKQSLGGSQQVHQESVHKHRWSHQFSGKKPLSHSSHENTHQLIKLRVSLSVWIVDSAQRKWLHCTLGVFVHL